MATSSAFEYVLATEAFSVPMGCCGPSKPLRTEHSEQMLPLLQTGSSALTTEQLLTASSQLLKPCGSKLLVMRHAHRADEADEAWSSTAERPWDPPLSTLGLQQSLEAAQMIASQQASLQIQYVVVSPFQRCLQTSAPIVAALGLPPGRWLVDWALSEVCEPRLMLAGRSDVAAAEQGEQQEQQQKHEGQQEGQQKQQGQQQHSGSEGVDLACTCKASAREPAAGARVSEEGAVGSGGPVGGSGVVLGSGGWLAGPVELPGRPLPAWPERREQALRRYQAELQWLQSLSALQGNVLVVTHGEAVRCAVNAALPDVTVYEVQHCGYALLTCCSPPHPEPHPTSLDSPGTLPDTSLQRTVWPGGVQQQGREQQQQGRGQQQQGREQQKMEEDEEGEEEGVEEAVRHEEVEPLLRPGSCSKVAGCASTWLLEGGSGDTGVSWIS
ncbi:histidine phosphatase superfamily [Haematococcus lacustris]